MPETDREYILRMRNNSVTMALERIEHVLNMTPNVKNFAEWNGIFTVYLERLEVLADGPI